MWWRQGGGITSRTDQSTVSQLLARPHDCGMPSGRRRSSSKHLRTVRFRNTARHLRRNVFLNLTVCVFWTLYLRLLHATLPPIGFLVLCFELLLQQSTPPPPGMIRPPRLTPLHPGNGHPMHASWNGALDAHQSMHRTVPGPGPPRQLSRRSAPPMMDMDTMMHAEFMKRSQSTGPNRQPTLPASMVSNRFDLAVLMSVAAGEVSLKHFRLQADRRSDSGRCSFCKETSNVPKPLLGVQIKASNKNTSFHVLFHHS